MTLTTEGLKFVAKYDPGLLPNILGTEIQDKSRANAFTKVVTYAQALWFCSQMTAMFPHDLTTSLLEINTAIPAACALLLYFVFWRNNPLNVDVAISCS
ncbi:uncharacterized protein M421DRAFT_73767 [Didymella exigua CBS 183.55]|uniref:Uncharacterized protein n=1 Tax=Didymella exigua CBS 183.55 TaxID=1150837 RepID=A0A6A5RBG6_9PLEO|nr:uncharacterized protein M421DRAFT_73767 [Didymella exigua CBS 183.55]KAF1924006.1 hypothetical protein M421DRAFT_73767 [Didymella exigua CBS 183.55]